MARVTCANHNTPGRDRGGTNFEALGNMKYPAGCLQTFGGEKVVKQGKTGRYQRSVLPALQRDYSTIPEREERLKAIARTHNYWLFTATADEIYRGVGNLPRTFQICILDAFQDTLKSGGMYGDPIPAAEVRGQHKGKRINGICLNTDILQPETIEAVKRIYNEIEKTGKETVEIGYLLNRGDLDDVFSQFEKDPGNRSGYVWHLIYKWADRHNSRLLRRNQEAERFGPWGAREAKPWEEE